MKLSSLKHGRDGHLVVVSRDLSRMVPAAQIVPTLQGALDDWQQIRPKLEALYDKLNADIDLGEPFCAGNCASPLPRAYQWLDASAYLNHVELVRKARGAELPESFQTDPIMYQGISDTTLAPTDPIDFCHDDWGIDFEAELAIVTDDVPLGTTPEEATAHIKLFMLVNDISLRNLIPAELSKGFGFINGKPPCAFAPVAVTPDEFGQSWSGGMLHLPISVYLNDELFGRPNAGRDVTFTFAQLITHAAKTRPLSAGTVLGAGTISNKFDGGSGKSVAAGGDGFACLAEQRMVETIETGAPKTSFLTYGDKVAIEMCDEDDLSVFGRIEQEVHRPGRVKCL